MLKYKHLEASREVRLWIGQIVVPLLTMGGIMYAGNPNVKNSVDKTIAKAKRKFKKE